MKLAGEKAGLQKRVWPHLLRHSDAIERAPSDRQPKGAPVSSGTFISPDDDEVLGDTYSGRRFEDSAAGGV